jgi:hypothetical protein
MNTTQNPREDELLWTGALTDPATVTDHFAGLHDGAPVRHCERCAKSERS